MRKQSWDQRRDVAVRLLARLSLVVVLAVLGALFVGGAATSQAKEPEAADSATYVTSHQVTLEQARPAGLVLGTVVIGSGLVVLMVGAFKPPPRRERQDLSYQ
jgi:Mn2+/Fe2+ NRAMP family transporter